MGDFYDAMGPGVKEALREWKQGTEVRERFFVRCRVCVSWRVAINSTTVGDAIQIHKSRQLNACFSTCRVGLFCRR